jgi:S-adenosylmethionine synthetase
MIELAEVVLPGHPDKVCDRIADMLVDEACRRDPLALVGVEVAIHQSTAVVTGCITTSPPMTGAEVEAIVRQGLRISGYTGAWHAPFEDLRLVTDLRLESLDDDLRGLRSISDDQAICVGWAQGGPAHRYLPIAHRKAWEAAQLLQKVRSAVLGPDGKVIVAVEGEAVVGLSLSLHHRPGVTRSTLWGIAGEVAQGLGLQSLEQVQVNGGGDFEVGGPLGDNGLSGKKLVVDAYGPTVPIGGGAWSGKDPHKIDRVGALRARQMAVRAVRRGLGRVARVELGWFPGDASPSHLQLLVDGQARDTAILGPVDWSIDGSWRALSLGQVDFADWADGGWFQRTAPWEFDWGSGQLGDLAIPSTATRETAHA